MFHESDRKPRATVTTPQPRDYGEPKVTTPQRESATAPSNGASTLNALLGRGSEFDGKLAFEGAVRIDGKFTGAISTDDDLIIGEGAFVTAEITCGSVVVHGEVTGNIRATSSVELRQPAHVKGEITTPSLMVEKGVIFEGQSKMEGVSGTGKVIPIQSSASAAAESAD